MSITVPFNALKPGEDAADVRAAIDRVVASGWFVLGPEVEAFESEFAAASRVAHAVGVGTGTDAITLILRALDIGPGDEVITPPLSAAYSALAVMMAGARPVFADIEDRTLGLDPADVERRLTAATTALLPIHYAGIAAEMDGLLDLAGRRGLKVVEDAAHGLAASYQGRPLGTLGDAGCFSFHDTKNLTCGEGGALVLREPEATARAEIIREKGTNRAAFLRGEVDKYTWVAEGSSYVLSDVLAAILDAQLDRLAEVQSRRAWAVAAFRSRLGGWAEREGVRLPPSLPDRESNHHLFYLLFPSEAARDRAAGRLRSAGVMATFHYVPLHTSPQGRALGLGDLELPVTDRVARTLLRLPLHPLLTDQDLDRVVAAVETSLS